MAGGLFRGGSARLVALVGLAVGISPVAAAYRRRPTTGAQALVVPAATVVGTLLALASSPRLSVGELPGLVRAALGAGGLGGASALALGPGWVFLLVVLFALLGAAAASLALGLGRVKLGIGFGAPFLFAAAVRQPAGSGATSSVGAIVLLVASLAVAFAAERHADEAVGSRREVRSAARTVVLLALVGVGVAAVGHADFLFPASVPRRAAPVHDVGGAGDRILFRVRSDRPGPWRVAVLDTYADGAFVSPSGDPRPLDPAGAVPGAVAAEAKSRATFTVVDLPGKVLPSPANSVRISTAGFGVAYDARTQLFESTARSVTSGTSYSIDAAPLPDPSDLRQAPPAPGAMRPFLAAPAPPAEVSALRPGPGRESVGPGPAPDHRPQPAGCHLDPRPGRWGDRGAGGRDAGRLAGRAR